ncbi:MAG: helix-turn-helix transcriptional regulator [Methanosphaera stadtmanae]|nr:helix-turn-helix transcriptional regulator [Methanosphaera stadtmanae]
MENEVNIEKCPIDIALTIINKKWVILIIRDMFFGKKHFNEFKENKPQLSNKVLSNCLKDMQNNGLIKRNEDENSEITYELTDKGLALNKVLYELVRFTLYTDLNNTYYNQDNQQKVEELFKKVLKIE